MHVCSLLWRRFWLCHLMHRCYNTCGGSASLCCLPVIGIVVGPIFNILPRIYVVGVTARQEELTI